MTIQAYLKNINSNLEILEVKKADLTGGGKIDTIYLLGTKNVDSPYITNITLVVKTSENTFYKIDLSVNSGYTPSLTIGNFTKENFDSILISINSGGSGGFSFYYIYNFKNNHPNLIFDFEKFNQKYVYEVKYEDDYQVIITNKSINQTFIVNISNRSKAYLNSIYDGSKLKNPIFGDVSSVNSLYPISYFNDGYYDLIIIQRVIGLYNADLLGYMVTPLSYQDNGFDNYDNIQYFSILGQQKEVN